MSELDTHQKSEALMREGLDHYAMGDDARAIACWRQVLDLDPDHAEAQDYLRTATDDGGAVESPPPASAAAPAESALLPAALELLGSGETAEALELLETLEREDPSDLAVQGPIELARAELLERYRDRLCDGIAVPQLRMPQEELVRFNLPADAGFVLSNIDGSNAVNDLVEVSGLNPFEVLRTCCRLIDAGIIEVHP
jgi:tetratricopeptide (TPR) repeat protein